MNLEAISIVLRHKSRGNRPPISEKQRAKAEKEHGFGVVSALHSRGSIFHNTRAIPLVALLLTSLLFPLIGCSSNDEDVSDKLDSGLNQLIEAEKRGELELLAQQGGIEIVDGSMKVVVECANQGSARELLRQSAE